MIYNLVQYLKTELPTETIFANLYLKINPAVQLPDRLVLVRETGGTETAWFQFQSRSIQIIARDIDPVKARKLILDINDKINNKFGLILPAVTVDGTVYPAVETAQISINTLPQSVGFDPEGRSEFSVNYRILLKET
jgi:hypothetical protein